MKICSLSDLRTMSGVKIGVKDILIPKNYYTLMLSRYPETLELVHKFFEDSPRAKAVVIIDFEER